MGAARPQTPRCFQVLDLFISSTWKLQFYVELAKVLTEKMPEMPEMPFLPFLPFFQLFYLKE